MESTLSRYYQQILKRGRMADIWSVIGTTSRTAGSKLVKTLNIQKRVGRRRIRPVCDKKKIEARQSSQRLKTFAPTKSANS